MYAFDCLLSGTIMMGYAGGVEKEPGSVQAPRILIERLD